MFMLILGIETSCDETACAVVSDEPLNESGGNAGGGRIRANLVFSQMEAHRPYGGVVPEIAARAHLDHLDGLITAALEQAGVGFGDLSAVAATGGPGLIGGIMVGVMEAKAIAYARDLPFIAVNHLEGHALSARLVAEVPFPYLLLLVSGGHCQLQIVAGVGRYTRLGTTVDDAAGECFDKGAKLLGLSYPGGPAVARAAETGNPARFPLPRPMAGRPGCDFSFSGLKTALAQTVEKLGEPSPRDVADLAAGLQAAIIDCLIDRTANALAIFRARHPAARHLVAAGGVASNRDLRDGLGALAAKHGCALVLPPPNLCTDNAAMIAWAGIERFKQGVVDGLDFAPRPRWPLDPNPRAKTG